MKGMHVDLIKLTSKERAEAQAELLNATDEWPCLVELWQNEDGTWACQVVDKIFEAWTVGELLRELANMTEAA